MLECKSFVEVLWERNVIVIKWFWSLSWWWPSLGTHSKFFKTKVLLAYSRNITRRYQNKLTLVVAAPIEFCLVKNFFVNGDDTFNIIRRELRKALNYSISILSSSLLSYLVPSISLTIKVEPPHVELWGIYFGCNLESKDSLLCNSKIFSW